MVKSSDEERPAYVRAVSRESRYIHGIKKERASRQQEKTRPKPRDTLKGGATYG